MAHTLSAVIFAVAAAPDGALAASLCMDMPDWTMQAARSGTGGPVQVWDCLMSDLNPLAARENQQWTVRANTDGSHEILAEMPVDAKLGLWVCLDLASGDTTNGNAVQAWECNGLENQQWVIGFDNHIRYFADQSKCVDAGDMQDGIQLMIWDCNGLSQQNWGYDSDSHMKTIYLSDSRRLQVPGAANLSSTLGSTGCVNAGEWDEDTQMFDSISMDDVCARFCQQNSCGSDPSLSSCSGGADGWVCHGTPMGDKFFDVVAEIYHGHSQGQPFPCCAYNAPPGGCFMWRLTHCD